MRPVLRSKAKNEKFPRPKPANSLATKAPERLEKAPTGITGLDEVTFGGLPRGRATLITGSAGCGAEAALRMRDEFLAIASHELRTPLSTLILRLELLEHQAAKGDLAQVQTSVRRAQDQTERIGRLVDRLLDVSQLASGRLKLDLAPCDLGDVVKEVAERLLEHAANVGSELRLTLNSGISAQVDKFRLEEAISNVISNAIKYGAGHPLMSN